MHALELLLRQVLSECFYFISGFFIFSVKAWIYKKSAILFVYAVAIKINTFKNTLPKKTTFYLNFIFR